MNVATFIMDSVLNTLWQSALVAGAVWAGLKFSPARVNAATRYVIWWIALVVVLTLPWIHRASPVSEHAQRPADPALQHALPAEVAEELARMDRADLLVLQYPMWWHLAPAMLKGWFDRVFAYGDAYTSAKRFENGRCMFLGFRESVRGNLHRNPGRIVLLRQAVLPREAPYVRDVSLSEGWATLRTLL